MNLLIIHGPNLNNLGKREPDIYGTLSLSEINHQLKERAKRIGIEVSFCQSSLEGDIVETLLKVQGIDGIIINAAAFTHSSIAIRDALCCVKIPFIEVHLSNVFKRETFRHQSYLADKAIGVISGLGHFSYLAALDFFGLHFKS